MHKPLRYEGNILVTSAAACPAGGTGNSREITGENPYYPSGKVGLSGQEQGKAGTWGALSNFLGFVE